MQLRGSKQAAVAGGAVIAALAIAACSSSSSSSSSSTPASTSGSSAAVDLRVRRDIGERHDQRGRLDVPDHLPAGRDLGVQVGQPEHHGQLRQRRFRHGPQQPVLEHRAHRRLGLAHPGQRAVQGSRGQDGAVLPGAVIGPIALSYNLSGVSGLKLDPTVIANIFQGNIKTWNDPAIKALNPGVSLPSTAITTAVRSDSSGTTQNFTLYLEDAARSAWKLGSASTIKWPSTAHAGAGGTRRGADHQVDPWRHRLRRLQHRQGLQPDASRRCRTRPATTSHRPRRRAPRTRRTSRRRPTSPSPRPTRAARHRLPGHLPVLGPGVRAAAQRQRRGDAQGLPRLPARQPGQQLLPSLFYAPLPSSLDQKAVAQLSQITSS